MCFYKTNTKICHKRAVPKVQFYLRQNEDYGRYNCVWHKPHETYAYFGCDSYELKHCLRSGVL